MLFVLVRGLNGCRHPQVDETRVKDDRSKRYDSSLQTPAVAAAAAVVAIVAVAAMAAAMATVVREGSATEEQQQHDRDSTESET
ncbi:hypothetical protein HZH68_011093 [Vespula germanica]|uniref:Uncharacterized protein n=1 Tax=Vespula germanica TaxID=30212 RepID=A0A834N0R1_VESGE|nr:hypothetical protein HZH68_011093 [Vespula germanica]